ncbi:MAG: heavy metal translocating P-type ATPase metal-binding domain-containing protein [Saprospiraceae bacterium]|nr:heavy metal translocating P-type ATPase metal-binding domain-containing protein [Saprospiraceae bacterium]
MANQLPNFAGMSQDVISSVATTCYHCGEDCGSHIVEHDGKNFCCDGCKVVYSILQENDLCNYYTLNEASGVSFKRRSIERYSHLDNQDVKDKLLDFTDGNQSRVHFHLPQIHCSSCLWLLENLNRLDPGVLQSRVNFLKKEVTIIYEEKTTSIRKVVELLATLGYAPVLNMDRLEQTKVSAVDKSLYYKIGLAGFAFGNIMLLSFPEYLGMDANTDSTFARFFGYLNILLALPVVVYSGFDYLRSAWQGLKQGHLNIDVPVSLGILALFGRSVFEILSHTGAGYLDSLAGLIFFLLVGKWFQQKAYHTISFDRDYKSYFPMATTVVRDHGEEILTLDQLKKGDQLLIRNGELVPADAILLNGEGRIDYSFVTGESQPVVAVSGEKVYAGGRQVGGTIRLEVIEKVAQSYLTSLWNDNIFDKQQEQGTTSRIADRVATFFTVVILLVAISTLIYWLPYDRSIAFHAFTAVLIVACPCAVALSIPFTFGNVMRILGNNHFYLKNIQVVETMAEIKQIVFDKTGTITYGQGAKSHYEGDPLSARDKALIRSLAHQSSHPVSRQIDSEYHDSPLLEISDFVSKEGLGIRGTVDGVEVIVGSYRFIKPESEEKYDGTWIEIGGEMRGAITQSGRYRQYLRQVVADLARQFTMYLLTGDNNREKDTLYSIFGASTQMEFEQSPQQKLGFIKAMQRDGAKVMMIGDGLNDAGALKQSDVGVVVTEEVNNFVPSCDGILDANQFSRLPVFLRFSRLSRGVVYGAYIIALIYNIIGLSFAVQGLLSPVIAAILMPLSSVTIVLFGMGLSTLIANRLGMRNSE